MSTHLKFESSDCTAGKKKKDRSIIFLRFKKIHLNPQVSDVTLNLSRDTISTFQIHIYVNTVVDFLHAPKLLLLEKETKLNPQNFFLLDHVLMPSGSAVSISATPSRCWLNTSERCCIDRSSHIPFLLSLLPSKGSFPL